MLGCSILGCKSCSERKYEDITFQSNELYNVLRKRATAETTPLAVIYEQEATQYAEGAQHLLYESVLPSMRVWRRGQQLAVPTSLAEYARALGSTPYQHHLLGHVTAEGASAVILGMNDFGQCLAEAQIVVGDGTFDTTPTDSRACHLLTLHTINQNRYFHPVIAIMENKSRALYDRVLELVWRLAGSPTPELILTDYEEALQLALFYVCPTAQLLGCFFHYAQALERQARNHGISTLRCSAGSKMLRLYSALALLPADQVASALAELPEVAATVGAIFDEGFDFYFREQWMQRIGPDRFAVGAAFHRTTNVAQIFHRQLNTAMRSQNPNIWDLTGVLSGQLKKSADRFRALEEGNLKGARNFARLVVRKTPVLKVHDKLISGSITLRQCLLELSRMLPEDSVAVALDVIGAALVDVVGDDGSDKDEDSLATSVSSEALSADVATPTSLEAAADAVPEAPQAAVAIPKAPQTAPSSVLDVLCQICLLDTVSTTVIPHVHTVCALCAHIVNLKEDAAAQTFTTSKHLIQNYFSAKLIPCGHTVCALCAHNLNVKTDSATQTSPSSKQFLTVEL